ncbi:hypothetical protein Chor_000517 [Crotalus horridus]
MAEYLASIFGTEKDKVNCSFYFKIGACRHGDRCSRLHNKPTFSQTILIQNIYRNPQNSAQTADGSHYGNQFVKLIFHNIKLLRFVFQTIALLNIYRNPQNSSQSADGLRCAVSDVEMQEHYDEFFEFRREEDAEKAVIDLNNRWFNGQPIHAELSPVTDFREACCRQYEMGECTRGGFCNFMHLKPISRELRRELYGRRRKK